MADADYVYTSLWWWEDSAEYVAEVRRKMQPYQVNEALWARTKPGARFMHCLPAVRGDEVTDAIIDGPASMVWDMAENRKHLQKAVDPGARRHRPPAGRPGAAAHRPRAALVSGPAPHIDLGPTRGRP